LGIDEYADGIFPHFFKACQLLVIVVHEVTHLLSFAPAHESADRLTRSLADFAKLVELFDQHGVSFVSITQSSCTVDMPPSGENDAQAASDNCTAIAIPIFTGDPEPRASLMSAP
jgi:hypothetical protein